MKIRKKLFLGFGLLFIVVLFFGAFSMYYIEEISETAKVTLKNNYETLTFTREMRSVLDETDLPLTLKAAETFNKWLAKQEKNITEPGEKEATARVRYDFMLLIGPSESADQKLATVREIRALLKTIDGLNMQAIVQKNNATHETVNKATLYLGGMGLITFLIIFILIANFPGFIINPLHQLAEGLQDIREKNYDTRLEFKTSNEFAELSTAFNAMAEELGKLENANLTRIMTEGIRIKALVEETPDAVFGLNENKEIIFMNAVAKKILAIEDKKVIGKHIDELIKKNSLLKTLMDAKHSDEPLKVHYEGKTSLFQQKSIEIVAPNLKPNLLDALQFSGFPAGMIYVLKDVTELKAV